jgi:hypothetical protein
MMIPGQLEPRRFSTAAAPAPAPAAAATREPATTRRERREMATWLEVSIAAAVLVGLMVFAMWASHAAPRVVMGPDRLEVCPFEM